MRRPQISLHLIFLSYLILLRDYNRIYSLTCSISLLIYCYKNIVSHISCHLVSYVVWLKGSRQCRRTGQWPPPPSPGAPGPRDDNSCHHVWRRPCVLLRPGFCHLPVPQFLLPAIELSLAALYFTQPGTPDWCVITYLYTRKTFTPTMPHISTSHFWQNELNLHRHRHLLHLCLADESKKNNNKVTLKTWTYFTTWKRLRSSERYDLIGSQDHVHDYCFSLVDGHVGSSGPILDADEGILEGAVVRRADTSGRVIKVLPSSRCVPQSISGEAEEAQRRHPCGLRNFTGEGLEGGGGISGAYTCVCVCDHLLVHLLYTRVAHVFNLPFTS